MLKRLAHSVIVIVAAVGTPSLVAHMAATPDIPPAVSHEPGDDGWRLTKDGWEQLSPRVWSVRLPERLAASQRPAGPHPDGAWTGDMHPAALTLLLFVGAISAFCLFPHLSRRKNRR